MESFIAGTAQGSPRPRRSAGPFIEPPQLDSALLRGSSSSSSFPSNPNSNWWSRRRNKDEEEERDSGVFSNKWATGLAVLAAAAIIASIVWLVVSRAKSKAKAKAKGKAKAKAENENEDENENQNEEQKQTPRQKQKQGRTFDAVLLPNRRLDTSDRRAVISTITGPDATNVVACAQQCVDDPRCRSFEIDAVRQTCRFLTASHEDAPLVYDDRRDLYLKLPSLSSSSSSSSFD
jgi:hypothetical protein